MMYKLLATLRAHAAKRALYRQTRDELAALPPSVSRDLGIGPHNAARVAHQAVWG